MSTVLQGAGDDRNDSETDKGSRSECNSSCDNDRDSYDIEEYDDIMEKNPVRRMAAIIESCRKERFSVPLANTLLAVSFKAIDIFDEEVLECLGMVLQVKTVNEIIFGFVKFGPFF